MGTSPGEDIASIRALVRRLLEQRAFRGRDVLLQQVPGIEYVSGPVTMMRLRVPRTYVAAVGVPSPVPNSPTVMGQSGEMVGMLHLWLDGDGYVDCLEYSWVTDEVPTALPTPESLLLPAPPVFVVDGHDIELYPDAESAAAEIEGYDAANLEYWGADGTVFDARVEGPEWGRVSLHVTPENRLDELLRLLRAEATARGISLPADLPDDPEAIWSAVCTARRPKPLTRLQRFLKRPSK